MKSEITPQTVPMQCTAFNLGKAYRNVLRLFERSFRSGEVSSMQYGLLIHIAILQPASGRDISAATGHDPSTLSRTLGYLVENGWIRVNQEVDGDRRKRLYTLTSEGERVLSETMERWDSINSTIADRLGRDQWRKLLQLLAQLQKIDIN